MSSDTFKTSSAWNVYTSKEYTFVCPGESPSFLSCVVYVKERRSRIRDGPCPM